MGHLVTLNVDLGELADEPEELYVLATVVNIACGGHAGDAASMSRAIYLARASGAEIVAHPSYPDRPGFGRKTMAISPDALRDAIAEQCAALQSIARGEAESAALQSIARGEAESAARQSIARGKAGNLSRAAGVEASRVAGRETSQAASRDVGSAVRAVKLHGALYHDAARDPAIAEAVMEGAARGLESEGVVWIGPARGALWSRAQAAGLACVREGFADRGTLPDGSLVPRGQPGALIEDPDRAAAQALAIARSGAADTLCVHSDTPNAVAIARAVRAALEAEGLLRDARQARA